MRLTFGQGPLVVIAVLGAAALLALFAYARSTPDPGRRMRILLGCLRWGSLAVIGMLLLEPVIEGIRIITKPPLIAVLIDSSTSIDLSSGTDSGASAVRRAARRALDLEPRADIRLYRFGTELRELDVGKDVPDSIRFDDARTDIARALDEAARAHASDNLQAMVLVSDGRYNTGRNPVFTAERSPAPIYTLTAGDTTAHADLRMTRFTTNEVTYVGNELPVDISFTSEGLEGRRVSVELLDEGVVVERRSVLTPPDGVESTVRIAHVMDTPGTRRLQGRVTRLPEELTADNNVRSMRVRVQENRRRVLVIAAAPGPDLAALVQILRNEPDLEVTLRTQRNRESFYEGPFPDDLAAFDVLVLAGYPGRGAADAAVRRVAATLASGQPALFVLSPSSDIGLFGRYLGESFGIEPQQVRRGYFDAVPILTPEGRRQPIIADPDGSQQAWRRLPPLSVPETRWSVAPDVRVLVTYEVRGITLGDPLLLVRERGDRRAAGFLGAGSWKWANVPEGLEDYDDEWRQIVLRTIRWLSTRRDDRLVRVDPTQPVFSGSERVRLTGQVYDESLDPLGGALVEVSLRGPAGVELRATMQEVTAGLYDADLGALPEGSYEYAAVASRDDSRLGEDRGSFDVGSLGLESRETTADVAIMRQIASRSGGRHALVADSGTILDALPSEEMTPTVVEDSAETELWRHPALLALILLLLTGEWFLRKRSGLV